MDVIGEGARTLATLHLVSGPIGAGKTTKALKIVDQFNAILLSADLWMQASGIPLRNTAVRANVERAQLKIALLLLSQGRDVVIDWGTWARSERLDIISSAKAQGDTVNGYFITPELGVLMSQVENRESNWSTSDRATPREIAESLENFEKPQNDELLEYAEIWFSV
jgi:predicted kinase